ncbi:MAG: hypothetical protein ABIR84_04990 [Candidatus Nitrotoga sp.]
MRRLSSSVGKRVYLYRVGRDGPTADYRLSRSHDVVAAKALRRALKSQGEGAKAHRDRRRLGCISPDSARTTGRERRLARYHTAVIEIPEQPD